MPEAINDKQEKYPRDLLSDLSDKRKDDIFENTVRIKKSDEEIKQLNQSQIEKIVTTLSTAGLAFIFNATLSGNIQSFLLTISAFSFLFSLFCVFISYAIHWETDEFSTKDLITIGTWGALTEDERKNLITPPIVIKREKSKKTISFFNRSSAVLMALGITMASFYYLPKIMPDINLICSQNEKMQ